MKAAVGWLIPYVVAVLVLSSIDVTYEWLSPLPPGGESITPTEWYNVAGLRNGGFLLAITSLLALQRACHLMFICRSSFPSPSWQA